MPSSASRLVWEISSPQPATHRFSAEWFTTVDCVEPVYVVGVSNPTKDWPRIQPGPLNAATGFRELSATVEFEADNDAGNYWHTFEIEALDGSGPCPDLRVNINGHLALLVPQGRRDNRAHAPMPPNPIAGVIHRQMWIPPGYLIAGTNQLVLTTIAPHPFDTSKLGRQQRPDLGAWFGSTLHWIRLALHRESAAELPKPEAKVLVTPLYVQGTAGGLDEIIDVIVESVADRRHSRLSIVMGEYSSEHDLNEGGFEFGDVRLQIAVPELKGPESATLTISGPTETWTSAHMCSPARKWTVHLLPHVHLDIGYTDSQSKVVELHSRNVDKSLAILEKNSEYAFSIDGSFIVQQFLRSRDDRRAEEALTALRSRRLSVNAFWALLLSGIAGLEDLYRAMYFAAQLQREYGVPIDYANLTDVPSYTSALPSILAAAGVNNFMGIANHTRGGNADSDALHLMSPVRWRGPDGASVLAFFADCYSQLRFICADPPTIVGAAQGLSRFLTRYERSDYLPNHLPLVGTHADNEDLSHGYVDFIGEWNREYVWPQLRFSTISDYMSAVRPLYERLPELVGDGGSYWEDGVGTQARATAIVRRTQTLLPAVEAVSTLITSRSDGLRPDTEVLNEAWECVLIGSEHTWTSAHATAHPHSHASHDQLNWKLERIERGQRIATDEMRRALSQLSEQITTDAVPSILVVNGSSWVRSLFSEIEIDDKYEVIDEHGLPLPLDQHCPTRDGMRRVRMLIENVPAFGFKLLPLRVRSGEVPSPLRKEVPTTFETPHYSIGLAPDTGAVISLVHKGLALELIDQDSGWSLGELLYVSGGGSVEGRGLHDNEVSSILDYDPQLPRVDVHIENATMVAREIRRTPWGWLLTSQGSAPTIPQVELRIEFFDDTDRVEVTVTVDKEPTLAKESVYVAFPFAFQSPMVRYDRQQGWITPATDHQIGACNEWLTIQNAVTVGDDQMTIAWTSADAPLFTLSDVVRGTWARHFSAPNGTLLSWVMNNYWFTNTPAEQGGHAQWRYAFEPGKSFNAAAATRLGHELRCPALVSDLLNTDRCDDEPRWRSTTGTLYDVDLPENVQLTLFAGRAGAQFTVRVQETAGLPTRITLAHPGRAMLAATTLDGSEAKESVQWAALATATEDIIERLPLNDVGSVDLELVPYQVCTVCFGG